MLLHELCTNLGLVSRLASLFYEEALWLRSRYDSSGWLNSQGSLILMLVLLRIELKELLLGRGLSHAHWVIDGCGDVFADGADTGRSHRHGLSRVLDCRVGFVESFESRPLLDCITQFVFWNTLSTIVQALTRDYLKNLVVLLPGGNSTLLGIVDCSTIEACVFLKSLFGMKVVQKVHWLHLGDRYLCAGYWLGYLLQRLLS